MLLSYLFLLAHWPARSLSLFWQFLRYLGRQTSWAGLLLFGLSRHWIYCKSQWKPCNWIINTKWPQCHTYYKYIDQSWIMTNSIMYIIYYMPLIMSDFLPIMILHHYPPFPKTNISPATWWFSRWNNEILLTTGPFSVDIREGKNCTTDLDVPKD